MSCSTHIKIKKTFRHDSTVEWGGLSWWWQNQLQQWSPPMPLWRWWCCVYLGCHWSTGNSMGWCCRPPWSVKNVMWVVEQRLKKGGQKHCSLWYIFYIWTCFPKPAFQDSLYSYSNFTIFLELWFEGGQIRLINLKFHIRYFGGSQKSNQIDCTEKSLIWVKPILSFPHTLIKIKELFGTLW